MSSELMDSLKEEIVSKTANMAADEGYEPCELHVAATAKEPGMMLAIKDGPDQSVEASSTDAAAVSTVPAARSTDAVAKSTDPAARSTDPAAKSTDAAAKSTGPADQSTDATAKSTGPADNSTEVVKPATRVTRKTSLAIWQH